MADEDEFLKSLRVGKELGASPDEAQQARRLDENPESLDVAPDPVRGLRARKRQRANNVSFSQSIRRDAAQTFYDIALKHDWTMNKTLTVASELLKKADEEGKL